jgi:hypothetical protein
MGGAEVLTMKRIAWAVAVSAMTILGSTVIAACSDHGGKLESSKSSQDLLCFGDSGLCIDADVPDGFGGFPGIPGAPDAGFPGIPGIPDGGFTPPPGFDGGFGGGPLFGYCGPDPKYTVEYDQAVATFAVKPCFPLGCAPTECCYYNLACVAQ